MYKPMIAAEFGELEKQAPETAALYMRTAVERIDRLFGSGFAEKHPDLMAAFMRTAFDDFASASRLKVLESLVIRLCDALGEIVSRDNGEDSTQDSESTVTPDYSKWLSSPRASQRLGLKEDEWDILAERGKVVAINTPYGYLIEPASADAAKRRSEQRAVMLARRIEQSKATTKKSAGAV
jgi:hypothetical protein